MIGKAQETTLDAEGILSYKGRSFVPRVDDLIQKLLIESYGSRYFIHLGVTKMYRDLKHIYWWWGKKKDIVEFVPKCQNCQQVKHEHQSLQVYLKECQFRNRSGKDRHGFCGWSSKDFGEV